MIVIFSMAIISMMLSSCETNEPAKSSCEINDTGSVRIFNKTSSTIDAYVVQSNG